METNMKRVWWLVILSLTLSTGTTVSASAQVNVYAGYLNNLSGPPNPADIPTPFDPDVNTILIGSGGVATPHDTGVLRFENLSGAPITIDPGLNVVTQFATFQIWDGFLPVVLNPGKNLVLTETANFNFDTSDFGLGTDPVVSGSVSGTAFSFTDTARILLGHEDAGNTPETTPYGLLGRINVNNAVPEPGSLAVFGMGTAGMLLWLYRRRRS